MKTVPFLVILSIVSASDLRDTLVAMWAGQRSAVMTASFQYKSIMIGGSRLSKLTRGEVNGILGSIDLVHEPDDLKQLYDQLASEPSNSPTPWGRCEVTFAGEKVREVHLLDDSLEGQRTMENVFDGDLQITTNMTSKHKHATLNTGRSGAWANVSLSHFRFVPGITELNLDSYLLKSQSEQGVLIEEVSSGAELEVDVTNGFVHRVTFTGRSGDVIRETQQFGAVEYRGNTLFPTAIITTRYRRGILTTLRVIVIEKGTINEDVENARFAVSVPKDAVLVDKTVDPKNPRVFRLREEVEDVAKLAGQEVSAPRDRENSRVILMWISLVALGLLAAYLWRRRLTSGSRTS